MDAVSVSPFFLTDRALDPLKKLAGPVTSPVQRSYVFYLKSGNLWGSDGVNHTPVNPALMAYFDELFRSAIERIGRGSLFFILSENQNGRYGIVTDNHTMKATLIEYAEAIIYTSAKNFPSHEPALPE